MRDPARYVRGDMKVEILVYLSSTNSPCHLFLVYGTGPFDLQLSPLDCLYRSRPTSLPTQAMEKGDTRQELPSWYQDTRKKGISVAGNALFTILRLADLPFQYYLLSSGLGLRAVRKLGGTTISSPVTSPATAIGLSPYHTLVFGLAVGSATKQIYWCLGVADNKFDPGFSTMVAVYNTVLNTLNTLLSLWAISSNRPAFADTWGELFASNSTVVFGAALYGLGLWTEWWCEVQRKRFKQNPANKGKLCTEGLFGLARNINYGGYTLWRAGYSIVCAGLPWGVGMFAFLAGDFAGRAIPYLETYLAKKVSFCHGQAERQLLILFHSMKSIGARLRRRCHTSCFPMFIE